MYTIPMVSASRCSLQAESWKMAPTVGMVGRIYTVPSKGRGRGEEPLEFLGSAEGQPVVTSCG